MDLFTTLLVDGLTWALCLAALIAFAQLSVTHPAVPYLVFHGWFISARAVAILNGAQTLFSWSGGDPVRVAEISRAVLLADAGLISMTCGWILAAHLSSPVLTSENINPIPIQIDLIRGVAVCAIAAGLIAILLWSKIPGSNSPQIMTAWAVSNWAVIAQTWFGVSLLALIYCYGFRLGLVVPLAAFLMLASYQGSFRFRLLIPAILLVQIHVDRRGKKWPSLPVAGVFLACAVLFFPLKGIGHALQAGEPFSAIWQVAEHDVTQAVRGVHPDEMILDEFASTLTLADQHGKLFFGRTYSGMLTVAVPRQWWPEKPGLADFEREISSPGRPIALDGMVVTMLGEFYVNFWYPGVIVLSFAFAYCAAKLFHAAYCRGYFSVARFAYLMVACNLIEVYRDGLISLFVFVVVNMMPLTAIILLHFVFPSSSFGSAPLLKTPRVRQHTKEQPVA